MGTIQIKRGQSANTTNLTLQPGELALTLDTGELYGGLTSGKKLLNPKPPTPPVTSVNGQTGVVNITTITGNSGTATKLQTPRTISLTGGVTGSGQFDGSGNLTITTTVANVVDIDGGTF